MASAKELTKSQEELRDKMSQVCDKGITLDRAIEYKNFDEEENIDELEDEYQELFSSIVREYGAKSGSVKLASSMIGDLSRTVEKGFSEELIQEKIDAIRRVLDDA